MTIFNDFKGFGGRPGGFGRKEDEEEETQNFEIEIDERRPGGRGKRGGRGGRGGRGRGRGRRNICVSMVHISDTPTGPSSKANLNKWSSQIV